MYYKNKSETIFRVCNYTFLAALAVLTLFPFWYMIMNSISDPVTAMDTMLWPREFYYANYWIVFQTEGVWRALSMSMLRVLSAFCPQTRLVRLERASRAFISQG